ncbi:L-2-hydroxyglutarate oxidase [Flavobacteriaceae bacterium SZ-1-7]|uniref:L-2-hydroxyglutarate oxidase n=1 Tax=Tamlana sedimenti TaxID=3134126 RepID=UPI003121CF75
MKAQKLYDITIVGGGIVGAATAYKLQLKYPHLHLLLIEKENELAAHQTGNNSGVIHSGLYYKPGSAKAKNCVDGRKQLVKFAREYGIKHDVCGKVVAAVEESELPFMDKIFQNGLANNTEGIEKINASQLKEIEPFVNSIGGIWVPCTGIVDFRGTTEKLAELVLAKQSKSKIVLSEKVVDCVHEAETSTIITSKNKYKTKHVIFCGGLQADRLAKKDNVKLKEKVVGFRGDYYNLTEQAKVKVKNLIYPMPNPAFPFLGVHFTRMVNGDVECGPNAVLTFKREGYNKTDFNIKDTLDALSYSGTWNLLFNHTKFAINEYRRAFSKKLFLKTLQRLIPSLTMEDIEPGRAGVRAMLLKEDGKMQDDFRIEYKERSIHVLNAPSPAATACLAIGDRISEMATERFVLDS